MKNRYQNYYFLFSLFSFILVMFPFFHFDGLIIDTDFYIVRDNSFKNVITGYYNNVGLYRIISITFQHYVPQLLEVVPLKSYIAIFTYYFASYIIAEKVLKLLGVGEINRLLVFCAYTANLLIVPTALTISRTQNELFSAFIAWFFVWLITKNRGSVLATILLIIWGIASLLTYELHYPFLAILLLVFGYITKKDVIYGALLALLILIFFIPLGNHKIAAELSALKASSEFIIPYIQNKVSSALFSLEFIEKKNLLAPLIIIFLIILFMVKNRHSFNKNDKKFPYFCELQVVGLSLALLILIYTISWPSDSSYSIETIKSQGKLNWNVINFFWFNIALSLVLRLNSLSSAIVRILPILLLMIYSGLAVRSVSNLTENQHFDLIDKSLFRNINFY